MTSTPRGHQDLVAAVVETGYYPDVVLDALDLALGDEPVDAALVHHEPTLDTDGVFRHLSVLALTPRRLVVVHVDEHDADDEVNVAYASASTETVPLHKIGPVVVDRVFARPSKHVRGALPLEVVLSVGWGGGHLDLEPAGCADPECDADHGYSGTLEIEDFTVRVSAAADGSDAVVQALAFSRALSMAVGSAPVGPLGVTVRS